MFVLWIGLTANFYYLPLKDCDAHIFWESLQLAFATLSGMVIICVFNHSFNRERREKFKWSVIWSEAIVVSALILFLTFLLK
jgi:hypothetical protein